MPHLVLICDCEQGVAMQRFLHRKREPSDTAQVFEKRYHDYQKNLEKIVSVYQKVCPIIVVVTSSPNGEQTDLVVKAIDEACKLTALRTTSS
jgi:adenylate kinase family enzyme